MFEFEKNEIVVIGGYGNTQIVIRKTAEDELFEKVQLKDLLSETHQTRVLVQMTKGKIFVNIALVNFNAANKRKPTYFNLF